MFSKTIRIVVSLGAVLATYWCYALVVVPMIEPPAAPPRVEAADTPTRVVNVAKRHEQMLKPYFPPGHWVFDTPKVLESDQTRLLIKDYRNLPDGRVELKPCAMLFLPKPSTDPQKANVNEQVVILEVPGGAILQFDEAFDLRRAKVGKLIGGQLIGDVIIHSGPQQAGTAEELKIVTRDVELVDNRIQTQSTVEFRYGPHQGYGREMTMDLLTPDDPSDRKRRTTSFSGIQNFQLTKEVRLRMQMGSQGFLPGNQADKPALEAAARPAKQTSESPVEVTCKGPFKFDVIRQMATFSDQVDVLRLNNGAESDQLNCELLTIYFGRKREASPEKEKPNANKPSQQLSNLEPRRIEAQGDPVIVRAPSSGGHARCQRLEYDLVTGRISLEGAPEALLHQGANEIRTPKLDYEPAPSGQIGKLFAPGPGTLQGALSNDPARKYQAQWTRELRIRPSEENHVVSLVGGAQMRYTDAGSLAADEIHLWLREMFASTPPRTGTAVQQVALKPATSSSRITPDRMLAAGNVKMDSPQMSGVTGRLEMWFQQVAQSAGTGSGRQQGSTGATTMNRPPANKQHFDMSGSIVRLQVGLDGGRANLADVSIEGAARFAESRTSKPGELPLVAAGEAMHVAQADGPNAKVTVAGKPAHVEARGMSLDGARIQLERATNRLWVDGAGRMTMPATRDLTGGAIGPQTMEVTWVGKMNFDGRTVVYDKNVIARGPHQTLRTEMLEVALRTPIDFANPSARPANTGAGNTGGASEVELLNCRGGVNFESREFDGRGQTSVTFIQVPDLMVNQVTGVIESHGAGWLSTVRPGNAPAAPSGGLLGGSAPATSAAPATSTTMGQADRSKLMYLGVQFERGINGNLHRRELTFSDQVKAVYGPVKDWADKLDAEDPETLGPQGVLLNCEQLTVRETNPSASPTQERGPMELEAIGNTLVEGMAFTARAHRLAYAEAKDLLVLEGDGRTDAQLYRQAHPGAATTKAAARKIMYWRSTNRVEVDDARFFDFGQISTGDSPPATDKTGTKPAAEKPTSDKRPSASRPKRPYNQALPQNGFRSK